MSEKAVRLLIAATVADMTYYRERMADALRLTADVIERGSAFEGDLKGRRVVIRFKIETVTRSTK